MATEPLRQINSAGLHLIESFEGLKLQSYQDSVGVWTIGYGHTDGVHAGQTITQDQASEFLQQDLAIARTWVRNLVDEHVIINDNQFAALVSITFNVGQGCLINTHLIHDLLAKNFTAAAEDFLRFDTAGGNVLPGLLRRREAEKALFLTPVAG